MSSKNIIDFNKYKELKDFTENYMYSSPTTGKFQSKIDNQTYNAKAFDIAFKGRRAIKNIEGVDPNAISSKINLTAKHCGASISKQATIQKNKPNRKYTARQKQVFRQRVAAILVSLSLLGIGVGSIAKNITTTRNLSATNNEENGYEVLVTSDTQAKLNNIKNAIEQAKSLGVEPFPSTLSEIKTELDDVYDDIMSDLVTKAFKEKNKDCTVNSVETRYDKTVNQYISSGAAEPNSEYFCTISYTDKNGDNSTTVMKFDSDITKSFEDEYKLDNDNLTLSDLEKIYENADHLAGKEFEYHKGILDSSLKSGKPDKISHSDKNNDKDER